MCSYKQAGWFLLCFRTIMLILYAISRPNNFLLNNVPDDLLQTKNEEDTIKSEDLKPLAQPDPPSESKVSSCPANGKVKHFVMTKIEKTGSSTLFGLLTRFAMSHKLNILSPKKGRHISWTSDQNHKAWLIGPQTVERADVLINHAHYNKTIFDKHIKEGYKYIVPVREPVAWMKSAVPYFYRIQMINESSPERVISNDDILYTKRESTSAGTETLLHLAQLQWVGFDYSFRNDLAAIKDYIAYIVPKIDIPILTDQFDASLLILKRRFCWDYIDIFYQSYVVTDSLPTSLSEKSMTKLLSAKVNLGDRLLYEAVNRTWWEQPETRDRSFWKEVSYYKGLNRNVSSMICSAVSQSRKSYKIPATQYHAEFFISPQLCRNLKAFKGRLLECTMKYVRNKRCSI